MRFPSPSRPYLLLALLLSLLLLAGCAKADAVFPSSEPAAVQSSALSAASSSSVPVGSEAPETSGEASSSSAVGSASMAASSGVSVPADTSAAASMEQAATAAPQLPAAEPVVQEGEMRAVWISYYELDGRGKNADQFADMIGGMFDKIKSMGLNTVVVHVRANSDAFYPSSYFPWSEYAAGQQGQNPGYDPLNLLIEAAHERGLAFHAWLNPYRVSNKTDDPMELAENNPARVYLTDVDTANDSWVIPWDGGIYYNPGVVEMQKLILDGVREILDNYDVDGIHFDDYFYPTSDPAFDAATYGAYAEKAGDNALSLGDWRRANVNSLMQAVYRLADSRGVPFGISPSAHISDDGSDRNYQELYADIALWMREGGYAHYITPQLYFGFQYSNADFRFDNLLSRWLSLPRAEGMRLYVGLAAYKIGTEDAGSTEWQASADILSRQLSLLRQAGADGFMLYSYGSIVSDAALNQAQMQAFQGVLQS